jgi:lipopolysaccharide transport system permease protein
MTEEQFRALGHELVDRIAGFLASLRGRAVTPRESADKVRTILGAARALPEEGEEAGKLLRGAADLLFEHSLHNGHPRFYGYITSSAAPIGMLAELLAAAVNANVGAWKLAPMATEIEGQVIRWLAQFIGYPMDCGGLLLSGGNMANVTCFLAARTAKAGWDVRKQGVGGGPPLRAYASKETHTWIQKAADLAGRDIVVRERGSITREVFESGLAAARVVPGSLIEVQTRGLSSALRDVRQTIGSHRIWMMLANQDVKQRYRRSILGPFWITLSAVVSIIALALVYTQIFNVPTAEYLVFLTTGFVAWMYIASILIESCTVFISAEGMIRQVNLPLGIHVFRMVWRSLITLTHNLVIVVLVLVYMGVGFNWAMLAFVPGLVLSTVAAIALGYLLGGVCTRYRDIPPIVVSLVQVLFYVTPVIWPPKLLQGNEHLLTFNPFYYFLEILRTPMIGQWPSVEMWAVSISAIRRR